MNDRERADKAERRIAELEAQLKAYAKTRVKHENLTDAIFEREMKIQAIRKATAEADEAEAMVRLRVEQTRFFRRQRGDDW